MNLVAVENLQDIRGISFPADFKFRQFIITAPPCSGKSTLIANIGGWPQEGFIDLARNGWWKSPDLTYRPREVHLGIPFIGFDKSLAVFDDEWLEADPAPKVDFGRIKIPPAGRWWFSRDWRSTYVFEFLLPPPEKIFAWKLERQSRGTHRVDQNLALDKIVLQHQAHRDIASFFHRSGVPVYIREGLEQSPKRLSPVSEHSQDPIPVQCWES